MKKTTMQRIAASTLTGLSMLVLAPSASAQWGRGASPSAGACFYEDIDYGGRYFCTRVGDSNPRVPSNINDEISSIRLFGNAEVIAFRDDNLRGESRVFSSGVRDLRRAGFNDRLTSYTVQPRGYASGNWGGYNGNNGYNNGGYNGNGAYNGNGGYNGTSGYNGSNGGAYDRGRGGYNDNYGSNGRGSGWGGRESNSRWTVPQAETMVRQGYRRIFGRDPDPGARGWVEQVMTNNWSQRQLEEALRNTPEGRRR